MNSSKKIFVNLSIGASLLCCPVFSEENKGAYITGSIGASQISDIEYIGSTQKVTFDSGLGLELGFGYDFGST